jgi:ketosteroid isomerase-like protein
MDETNALFEKYLAASQNRDIDAMAACWHDDAEGIHPLRPDRGWHGIDGFRRVWTRMWENNPTGRYEVISAATTEGRFYIEAVIELPDGTAIPSVNIFEVDSGKIRQVRVYTDVPSRDGVAIDDFIGGRHPTG